MPHAGGCGVRDGLKYHKKVNKALILTFCNKITLSLFENGFKLKSKIRSKGRP